MGGDNVDEEVENIHQRELEEASKVSACFDPWEESVEGEISKPNLDLADSSQGLSKSFRISVIIGSVLIMIVVILAIAVFLPHSSKKNHGRNLVEKENWDNLSPVLISVACEATQFPNVCRSSLMTRGIDIADIGEIIMKAMDLSSEGSRQIHLLLGKLLQGASAGNLNLTNAILNCLEFLEASIRWLAKSKATALYNVNNIPDIKTWLSAVLTYQTDCQSALKHMASRSKMVRRAINHTDLVIILTSNALSMIDALGTYGPNISSWRPSLNLESSRASSDNKWLSLLHENIPIANEIVPNLTVSKDGSSPYSTVQAAVDSAPDHCSTRFTIYIRAGVYEEIVRIPPTKFNLMLLGDGIGHTVITANRSAQDLGGSIYSSATVGVTGDGFVARDITFENSAAGREAGEGGRYGVSVRVDSDLSAFKNCAFRGHHYSLYAHALRHMYRDCTFEGSLVNSAATVFQNCIILVDGRPSFAS